MINNIPNEMKELRRLLDEKGIAWTDHSETFNGPAFVVVELFNPVNAFEDVIYRTWFKHNGHDVSVIIGHGTYGNNSGLLEIRIDECEPKGYMTASHVMEIIESLKEDEVYDEYHFVSEDKSFSNFVSNYSFLDEEVCN